MTKTRNRKPFNKVKFIVYAVYSDDTEEAVKDFKYKKAAERFVVDHTIENGRFEVREVYLDVL